MTSFGEKLRQEREARSISLGEIATETKIGLRYLEALESGDLEALPGGVFNKGYVRAYAAYIGADVDGLVQAYVEEERTRGADGGLEDRDVLRALADSATGGTSRPAGVRPVVFLVPLSIALAALAVWTYVRFVGPGDGPGEETGRTAVVSEAAPEEIVPQAAAEPPAVEPSKAAPTKAPRTSPPAEPSTKKTVAVEAPQAASTQAATEPLEAAAVEKEPSRLSIPESGVGTAIVNRQLQGQSDRFSAGTQLWFWTRVLGGRPGDRVRHVWIRDGRQVSSVELKLGGAHWRTQSRKAMVAGSVGSWAVEARDHDDRLLARHEFVCVP